MKIIHFIFACSLYIFASTISLANETIKTTEQVEKASVIVRIQSIREGTLGYPLKLQDKKMEKTIKELGQNDEVILQGHIKYESVKVGDGTSIRPLFVIESIKPISLKKLGKMDDFKVEEKSVTFNLQPAPYAPGNIKVTPEVAGAITITASVLLLRALATNPNEPKTFTQGTDLMIFSAGALATGVLILDQIKGKSQ